MSNKGNQLFTEHHADMVKKYSFVKDCYISGFYLIIEYYVNGKYKYQRLHRRVSVNTLMNKINKIRGEADEPKRRIGRYEGADHPRRILTV